MLIKHIKYLFTSLLCLLMILVIDGCKSKHTSNTITTTATAKVVYTCSMHPQIISDTPGTCPICGMNLVKKGGDEHKITEVDLNTLLKPTNTFVVSSIPVTTPELNNQKIKIDALGSIVYDTRQVSTISARYSGRIEKLYIKYRFQHIVKGQKIMDIYSPELMTAQQDLLFLLKNDRSNTPLISAGKQRLYLLGLTNAQVATLIKTGKPSLTISVFSNYSGHIHETSGSTMATTTVGMKDMSVTTEELPLKEGMYVQKGQSLFVVYDANEVCAVLNIYAEMQSLLKIGDAVVIVPETAPEKQFRAKINFIEPFFRDNSKTLTARVYFNNSRSQIPIGSPVKASIMGSNENAIWLPASSVVSLGLQKIVFIKQAGGFKAKNVVTGLAYQDKIQLISGLTAKDTVAQNGQYLMDSESFIKVNE
jgi:Cu(I)/Ag(I) efflux system membrane fusion protein